jgi:hypothetical protein
MRKILTALFVLLYFGLAAGQVPVIVNGVPLVANGLPVVASVAAGALTLTTSSLPNAVIGSNYSGSVTLAATGGTPPYTFGQAACYPCTNSWTHVTPAGVPFGVPQSAEAETITYFVRDSAGTPNVAYSSPLTLTVPAPGGTVSIVTGTTLTALTNAGHTGFQIICAGGYPPYHVASPQSQYQNGIMALGIDSYGNANLAPIGLGSQSVPVTCQDAEGQSASETITMTGVGAGIAYNVDPIDNLVYLPNAIVGAAYHAITPVWGGTSTYVSCTAPASWMSCAIGGTGLTGFAVLTGTPTAASAGAVSATMTTHDSGSSIASATAYLTVLPAAYASTTRPGYNTGAGLFVKNGNLYDQNGYLFVPRGTNRVHYDGTTWAGPQNGGVSAANMVRLMPAFNINFETPTYMMTTYGNAQHTANAQIFEPSMGTMPIYVGYVYQSGTTLTISANWAGSIQTGISASDTIAGPGLTAETLSACSSYANGATCTGSVSQTAGSSGSPIFASMGGNALTGGSSTSDMANNAQYYVSAYSQISGASNYNQTVINIANEWGGGSLTNAQIQGTYQYVAAPMLGGTTISGGVVTLAASVTTSANPFLNTPFAYIAGSGCAIQNQVVLLSAPAGSSGAYTITATVVLGGGSLSGSTTNCVLYGGTEGALRTIGYTIPLSIDCGVFGQNAPFCYQNSSAIQNSATANGVTTGDPQENTLFGLHTYGTRDQIAYIASMAPSGSNCVLTLGGASAPFHQFSPFYPSATTNPAGGASTGNPAGVQVAQVTGSNASAVNGNHAMTMVATGTAPWQISLTSVTCTSASGVGGIVYADEADAGVGNGGQYPAVLLTDVYGLKASNVYIFIEETGSDGNDAGGQLVAGTLNSTGIPASAGGSTSNSYTIASMVAGSGYFLPWMYGSNGNDGLAYSNYPVNGSMNTSSFFITGSPVGGGAGAYTAGCPGYKGATIQQTANLTNGSTSITFTSAPTTGGNALPSGSTIFGPGIPSGTANPAGITVSGSGTTWTLSVAATSNESAQTYTAFGCPQVPGNAVLAYSGWPPSNGQAVYIGGSPALLSAALNYGIGVLVWDWDDANVTDQFGSNSENWSFDFGSVTQKTGGCSTSSCYLPIAPSSLTFHGMEQLLQTRYGFYASSVRASNFP